MARKLWGKEAFYFIDLNKTTVDDFIKIEQIAALEAAEMKWKLFMSFNTNSIGRTVVGLN